jgi:hypothetical protein
MKNAPTYLRRRLTALSGSPAGCWRLAGDNIPGNRSIIPSRPGGALEHLKFKTRPKTVRKIGKPMQGNASDFCPKKIRNFFRALLAKIIGKSRKNRQKNHSKPRNYHATFDVFPKRIDNPKTCPTNRGLWTAVNLQPATFNLQPLCAPLPSCLCQLISTN